MRSPRRLATAWRACSSVGGEAGVCARAIARPTNKPTKPVRRLNRFNRTQPSLLGIRSRFEEIGIRTTKRTKNKVDLCVLCGLAVHALCLGGSNLKEWRCRYGNTAVVLRLGTAP